MPASAYAAAAIYWVCQNRYCGYHPIPNCVCYSKQANSINLRVVKTTLSGPAFLGLQLASISMPNPTFCRMVSRFRANWHEYQEKSTQGTDPDDPGMHLFLSHDTTRSSDRLFDLELRSLG